MAGENRPQQRNLGPVVRMGNRRGPGPVMNVEKPKNAGVALKRLMKYIGSSGKLFVGLIFIMVVITVLGLMAPSLQRSAIDAITIQEPRFF